MKMTLISTILFCLLIPSLSFAEGGGKGKGKKGFLKELQLSEQQRAKLKEHRQANKGQMKGKREEMKSLREKMREAFINGSSDSEFKSLNKKMNELKSEMEQKRFDKMLFFKNLLTKEQRSKFMQKRKSWKGKKGKRGTKK